MRSKESVTGWSGCAAVCLLLSACAVRPEDPQQNIPTELADITPMSQQDVDLALMAPELARAVKARAEHQPDVMLRAFRSAATQGNAVAQYQLAQLYRGGTLVPRDDKAGFDYARMAAEEGLGEAEVMLAEVYFSGRGMVADPEIAGQWLRLAEAQPRPRIWVMAGTLHLTGLPSAASSGAASTQALPADPARALALFHKAADQGNEDGELALCLVYMKGRSGIPASPKDGQPWCDRAAARGNQDARAFTATAPSLPQKPPSLASQVGDVVETTLVGVGEGVIAILMLAAWMAAGSNFQYSCC
jgi:TPR repeat protein